MPDQFKSTLLPKPLASSTGVAYNSPPTTMLPSISKAIEEAIRTLPPNTNGAIVGVATDKGVNAAIVGKVNDNLQVVGWVGKSWGTKVEGGGAVKFTW